MKISSDTLRYYDEIQLLNPDYINPANNYRFYNEEQVKELLYIMELKDCGFNLEEIKQVLKLGDEGRIEKLFEKKKVDLVNRRRKIDASIERITNKLKIMKATEENDMSEKILIVDDAPFMRMMVRDILSKNGYNVTNIFDAADGIDAIGQFVAHRPALVLMDITMPNMDGLAAISEIKKIDANAKFVMLSAAKQPEHIADSLIAGAVDFIQKPFQADRLLEVVRKHLAEDTELNPDIIKTWLDERDQPQIINSGADMQTAEAHSFDKKILSEKLLELLQAHVDLPVLYSGIHKYDTLTELLIKTISEYIEQGLLSTASAVIQAEIDALIEKAAA